MKIEYKGTIAAAWIVWSVTVLAYVLEVVLMKANPPPMEGEPGILLLAIEDFAFVVVATLALVVIRAQPANLEGWWLMMPGATFPLEGFFYELTRFGLHTWGDAGVTLFAGWVSRWIWIGSMLAIPLILLYYPGGSLPSPRWRWAASSVWGVAGLAFVITAFGPEPLKEIGNLPNPVGIEALEPIIGPAFGIVAVAYIALPLLGAVSIYFRYRRATGVERQQVKLIAWVAGVAVIFFGLTSLLGVSDLFNSVANTVFTLYIAVTITAGIIRYRLFEIDRLISRTVSYTIVVGVLGGVYIACITAISYFIPSDNALAVAASTLLAVSLFNPLRRRVRRVVDRRFNRSSYELQRVAERFAERLRGSPSTDELSMALMHTVQGSIQPKSIGIWLSGVDGEERRTSPTN